MSMWNSRLGIRLISIFGGFLLLMLGGGVTWLDHQHYREAEAQVERSSKETARALIASLKTIMLAGKGSAAHDWLSRVRKNSIFDDVRIYRRNGVEAFMDNATIDRVNDVLGEQRFAHHDYARKPETVTPALRNGFTDVVSGSSPEADIRSAGRLFLFYPVPIEDACLQCHGYDPEPIRGVLKLSLPTAAVIAGIIRERRHTLWTGSVIVLLSGIVLLWLLSREVIKPIGLLQAGAVKIKSGDVFYRVAMDRKDELGDLTDSLNTMVDYLQKQIRKQKSIAKAIIGLSREPADEMVLRHVGEAAMRITGARYCLLAYLEDDGKRFIPLGVDEATLEKLRDHPPQGLGLLGLLWNKREAMRVEDIAAHPEHYGFPEGHPPVTTMLGAPIEFSGKMLGALYMCDREDGRPFDDEDEKAVKMLAAACAVALSNAQQFKLLEEINAGLEQRVEERTREIKESNRLLHNREIELELMNEELRKANEVKNQFLANTSHELRTPLNSIIGFSDLLLTTHSEKLPAKEYGFLKHINAGGKQLLALINTLLDLSKIEVGMLEINEEPGSAGVVLDFTITQLAPLAGKKRLKLRAVKPEEECAVYMDTGKLRQVWINLIGNAVKFTPEGGRIEAGFHIRGSGEEQHVLEGYVQDTGIGIKPSDMERIFSPFVQGEGGLTREFGGTGLGLALVRRLLEMQGGNIRVESTPGSGSRFIFDLPVRIVPASARAMVVPAAQTEPRDVDAAPPLEVVEDEAPSGRGMELPLVLIIDDDKARAATVAGMLREEAYQGDICAMDQVERLAEEKCPFLIMVGMPEDPVDIYRRLHLLRSRRSTRYIPLVLLGGEPEAPHFSLGTVDTMDKQISRNDLVDLISRHGHHVPQSSIMTVLVVDDEAGVRDYIREALHGQGYRILLASNGRDGLQAAIEHEPDLIILDLMMPGMSGFEVVEELKRHPTACDIPVVIFTAKELTREEVMRLGQEVEKVLAKGATSRADLVRELRSLELLYPMQARLMDRVLRCFNPRYKQLRLAQECSRAKRYGHSFSLVGWEMDGFIDYAREHGKRWAVAALKETVELASSCIRKGDVLVRSGEAVFTVILPGIPPAEAERVAEKIRLRIRMRRFSLAGGEAGRLTASFGCSHFDRDEANTPSELVSRLHDRIGRARQAGGDTGVFGE